VKKIGKISYSMEIILALKLSSGVSSKRPSSGSRAQSHPALENKRLE
jgi:hypothetical protein